MGTLESPPAPPRSINRTAIFSLIAAILTVLSFCSAVAPVPFTGYVCFPASAITGIAALISGWIALLQIRSRQDDGRIFALTGVVVGGLASFATACSVLVGLLLLPEIWYFIHQFHK